MWNALSSSDLLLKEFASSSSTTNRSNHYYAARNENGTKKMSSSDLLKEFASSSSARNEDGTKKTFFTSTATTLHEKITKVVYGEVLRRTNDVDTYLAPLLVNEVNGAIKPVETSNKELDKSSDAPEADASDEPAVLAFLDSFTMESKSKDIVKILEETPDTVGKHFDDLVPNAVTYEQFWQRYYFRCDPERIQQKWNKEEEHATQELIENGKNKMQILYESALKTIEQDSEEGGDDDSGWRRSSSSEEDDDDGIALSGAMLTTVKSTTTVIVAVHRVVSPLKMIRVLSLANQFQ